MEQQLDEIKGIQMVPDNIFCASLVEQIVLQYCGYPVNLSSRNRKERAKGRSSILVSLLYVRSSSLVIHIARSILLFPWYEATLAII